MSGLDPPRKSEETLSVDLNSDGTAQCCRDGTSKGLATTG